MKCSNCGKNEVSCYYSSNINGNVTEKHLCAQCARELGLDGANFGRSLFSPMEEMFSGVFGSMLGGSFLPRRRARYAPFTLLPVEIHLHVPESYDGQTETEENPVKQDEELALRRRLNELRHSMKEAAQREDFETAAQLRDEIKALEAGGNGDQPQA